MFYKCILCFSSTSWNSKLRRNDHNSTRFGPSHSHIYSVRCVRVCARFFFFYFLLTHLLMLSSDKIHNFFRSLFFPFIFSAQRWEYVYMNMLLSTATTHIILQHTSVDKNRIVCVSEIWFIIALCVVDGRSTSSPFVLVAAAIPTDDKTFMPSRSEAQLNYKPKCEEFSSISCGCR